MPLKLHTGSLRFTILSIGNQKITLKAAGAAACDEAGAVLLKAADRAVSRTDHTLPDLAALDHPYARRHGSLTLHAGEGDGGWIRAGEHAVHQQSGQLRRSLYGRTLTTRIGYAVGFDPAIAGDSIEAISGNPRMLPRDPLWEAANGPTTLLEMKRAVVRALGKSLRSQAVIRFSP